MNSRLEANVLRNWRPGWRAGVAGNIAVTSAIPDTRKRRRARRAWHALFRVLLACIALAALRIYFN